MGTRATDLASQKSESEATLAGLLLSLGGILFFIGNQAAESVYPGYNVSKNFLSDLGAVGQPTTLLWNSQLFVSGLLWLLGIYLLFRGSVRNKLARAPFILAPVGQIVVSLFPENTLLVVHSLGALLAFFMGGVSALYAYRLTAPPFRYLSSILGGVALVSVVFFLSGTFLGLGGGGMERMIVYPIYLWLIMLGGYLMAMGRKTWAAV